MDPELSLELEVLYARRERDAAAWAEITLNRPAKGNALTIPMLHQLDDCAARIELDPSIRAVVLRGRGRFFSTGGDIAAWGALPPRRMARDWILPGIRTFERIAALGVPVIAAISGHALGGGLELALATDLRIAVEGAKLGLPEVTIGMIAGWMGLRKLAEIIGVARARQMALLGTPITAAQALDWGLVHAVAPDQAALEELLDAWLARLCANGPIAMALTKELLATMHADLRHHHAGAAAEATATADCREGVRAFLEKRPPVFHNR